MIFETFTWDLSGVGKEEERDDEVLMYVLFEFGGKCFHDCC